MADMGKYSERHRRGYRGGFEAQEGQGLQALAMSDSDEDVRLLLMLLMLLLLLLLLRVWFCCRCSDWRGAGCVG